MLFQAKLFFIYVCSISVAEVNEVKKNPNLGEALDLSLSDYFFASADTLNVDNLPSIELAGYLFYLIKFH